MDMHINVLNIICLFIGSYAIQSNDLCDVRIWYRNLGADGIFSQDLDRDQIKLKNNIESLVLKSSETETAKMIDCYIIEMYNEMLQDKYKYVYNRNIRGDIQLAEEQMSIGKGTDQNMVQNESSSNLKTETTVAGQVSADKRADVSDNLNERTRDVVTEKEAHPKHDEYDKLWNVNEIDETEFSEDEETVFSKEDEIYMLDAEKEAKESIVDLSEHTIKEPLVSNNLNTTSHEEGSEKLNITAPGEPSEPKAETMLNGVKMKKRSANMIPFGVCRKRYCTKIDIFDTLCCENSTGESSRCSQKKQSDYLLSLSTCYNGLFCSNQCFYVLSPTYCIIGYLSWIKNYEADTERGKIDIVKLSDQEPIPPDSLDGKLESSTEGTQISDEEKDEEKVNKSMPEARDEDQPKVHDVPTDVYAHELNIQKETHFSNSKDRLSLEEIELQMNKKTSEYGSKLQNLELMILRLENQLLLETMNKQNHSSTITKLENQILRLENILLNMNKKYSDLLSESQVMKARQIKYLELEQERKNDKYLALEDKSAHNFEMITQHQAKIIELTEKLENQTEIISNLKGRSEYIENHNRMLHQLIMNQTMFMSQIMQRVQDLSDQNSKQREETSILKQQLDMSLTRNKLLELKQKISTSAMSGHFMEQLDMLVSDIKIPDFDKKTAPQHQLQGITKNDDDDADVHFKDYLNRGSFDEQIVNWCPSENYSAPACMSNTLFNTRCPPYNNLIWKMCTGKVTQQNTSKTSVSVLDNNDGQIVNRESITTNGIDTNLQERPTDVSEGDKNASDHRKEDKKLSANIETIDATKADDEQKLQNDKSSKDESKYAGSQEHMQHAEQQGYIDKNAKRSEVLEQQESVDINVKILDVPEQQEHVDINSERSNILEQQEPVDRHTKRSDVLEQQEPVDINVKKSDVLEQQEHVDKNDKRSDVLKQLEPVDKNDKISDVIENQEPDDKNSKRSDVLEHQESVDINVKRLDVPEQQEHVNINSKRSTVLEQQESVDKNDKRSDVMKQQEPVDKISDVLKQQEPVDKSDKISDVIEQQESVHRHAKRSDVPEQEEHVDKNAKRSDFQDHFEHAYKDVKRSDVLEEQITVEANVKRSDFVEQQEPVDKDKRSDVVKQTIEDAHKNDDNAHTQQKRKEQEQDSSKGTTVPKEGTAPKAEAKKERKTPIYMTEKKQREPKDCYDYYILGNYKDGTYKIKPTGSAELIPVFCDMKRGGWTIIQKRQDGSTNFFRKWNDYKQGFGGLYGEHWIGNENIHHLTNQDYYSLRVDLRDWDKEWRYAIYEYFLVESEDNGYRLNIDGYSGDAGDGLGKHEGSKFSTTDVDNDKVVKEFGGSCANRFHGAGWYYKCYSSNLNGKYYASGTVPDKQYDGVTWKPWKGPNYSLRVIEMKIRPASVKDGK
ncbi:hypothetical protein ACJMK2_036567 [Sinanodonta woodiana]|uniref:Fibrinogen C-terminal domain-containing protein n=1 Tax=Sinanodonta woodiana TaxID=1069815 RepID=A0ABD3WIT4_SINWO